MEDDDEGRKGKSRITKDLVLGPPPVRTVMKQD